jgi:hypothetical protein
MRKVWVIRSLLFVTEAKAAKISEAYLTDVLLDNEDDLGIFGNLAKTFIKSCAMFFLTNFHTKVTLEAILNNVPC